MMTQKLRNGFEFIKKACFVCGSFNHLIKDYDDNKMVEKLVLNNKGRVTGQREIRPVWNNVQRVNHQNRLTHPHPKRNFVPTAVATKLGEVSVNAAKQNSPRAATSISTDRPVNTTAPKSKVNDALPKTYSFLKHIHQPKAVVSPAMGYGENAVKSSACWIWRPTGNVIDHTSKDSGSYMFKRFDYGNLQYTLLDQGIFDSGCSRDMTGNKSFLTDYQEIDDGFVAFGGSTKGVIMLELALTGNPQQEIGDEVVRKELIDRMERAATIASSLEVEQDSDAQTSSIQYELMVNPTIYTTCIEQFLTSAKVKTVNEEHQIQALVDKKKVIITETSIRSDLKLDDAEGTDCLPTATIFAELERMGITMASTIICLATNKNFNFSKYIFDNMVKNLEGGVKFLMYPRFVQVFLEKQVEGMSKNKGIYVIPSYTKKVFANMKRPGKGFSRKVTPLFETMMVQATKDMGEDLTAPTDSHSTPIHTQPFSSKPQKKKSKRKQRKDNGPIKPIPDEAINEEHVTTPSYDPPQSGEDRMQLTELMDLCTQLQSRVLALETTKSNQALEIESLKRRVKSLEKRRKSRTLGFKRLRKVGLASRVESSTDISLGAQEDASKQGRKIADLDADAEVTLVDETQEMNDDNLMFDTNVLEEQEKEVAKKEVSAADQVTTAGEVVTTANVEVTTANAPTTTIDELNLAQTLIEIKAPKPKVVRSVAITTTTTRPKARGVVVLDPSEFKTTSSPLQASQLPQAKDKGKEKMVEPKKPLKKKDQITMDEEVARNLEAQLQVELEEEERISRLKEEKANIVLLKSWDNTQVMMDADFQLAQQMQTEEQEQLSIEEKLKLFVELLEKRKKHFAALRAQEKRSKPPTKAQKRNTMSTYLKNMAGYKHNQLKSKMSQEHKGKKQKIDEHVEAKKDDDQEEAEMKKHIEIVKDDEVAIDAIPLATKPPVIVKYKIVKEGKFVYFQLIRADGSSKRYLSMIKMLQNIDREDLETL
ncbi:hypothetical protein Tco_0156054 [Tanacetum coccineum]